MYGFVPLGRTLIPFYHYVLRHFFPYGTSKTTVSPVKGQRSCDMFSNFSMFNLYPMVLNLYCLIRVRLYGGTHPSMDIIPLLYADSICQQAEVGILSVMRFLFLDKQKTNVINIATIQRFDMMYLTCQFWYGSVIDCCATRA